MSPASSIKRYADKWRAEQEPQSESLMRTVGKQGCTRSQGEGYSVVFAREGRDMRCFGYNRHAGNAGDAEGVQIGDFSRDPGM